METRGKRRKREEEEREEAREEALKRPMLTRGQRKKIMEGGALGPEGFLVRKRVKEAKDSLARKRVKAGQMEERRAISAQIAAAASSSKQNEQFSKPLAKEVTPQPVDQPPSLDQLKEISTEFEDMIKITSRKLDEMSKDRQFAFDKDVSRCQRNLEAAILYKNQARGVTTDTNLHSEEQSSSEPSSGFDPETIASLNASWYEGLTEKRQILKTDNARLDELIETRIREEVDKWSGHVKDDDVPYIEPEPGMFRNFKIASLLDVHAFERLADDFHEALKPEKQPEDLYRVLHSLLREPEAIKKLENVYEKKYKKALETALNDRLRQPEDSARLEYTHQLIKKGNQKAEQAIASKLLFNNQEVNDVVQRIHQALHPASGEPKTETIYASLTPYNRNTRLSCDLGAWYNHHFETDLRSDIENTLKDEAKDYALFLIGDQTLEKKVRSWSEAVSLQKALLQQTFARNDGIHIPVPYDYLLQSGTNWTHLMCEALKEAGYASEKIIALSLRVDEHGQKQPNLHVHTDLAPDMPDGKDPIITSIYHMAPLIQVETPFGMVELVVDPSLSSELLTIKQWMDKMDQDSFERISLDTYKTKLDDAYQESGTNQESETNRSHPADQTYVITGSRNIYALPSSRGRIDDLLKEKPIPDQDTSDYYKKVGEAAMSNDATWVPYYRMARSIREELRNQTIKNDEDADVFLNTIATNFLKDMSTFRSISSSTHFRRVFPNLYRNLQTHLAETNVPAPIVERFEKLLSSKYALSGADRDQSSASVDNVRNDTHMPQPQTSEDRINEFNIEIRKRDNFDKLHKKSRIEQKNKLDIERRYFYREHNKKCTEAVLSLNSEERAETFETLHREWTNFDQRSKKIKNQYKKILDEEFEKEITRRETFDKDHSQRYSDDLCKFITIGRKITREDNKDKINNQSKIDDRWTAEEIQEEQKKASSQVKDVEIAIKSKWPEIPRLNKFPVEQVWRLGVDGRYQQDDGPKFEVDDEPSFIAGTERLLNAMLDGLRIEGLKFNGHSPEKLTGQYFQQLHDIAIAGTYRQVQEGNEKKEFQIGYRGFAMNWPNISFFWDPAHRSENGTKELQEKFACRSGGKKDPRYGEAGHPVGNSCLKPFGTDESYHTKDNTWHECLVIADTIINKYHDEIGQSTNEDDKLTAIVRCCQDLDQAHLLPDGNIRTIAFGVLPKLLLENDFDPTILPNPNILDGYSVEEIKTAIHEGQKTFRDLCQSNKSTTV